MLMIISFWTPNTEVSVLSSRTEHLSLDLVEVGMLLLQFKITGIGFFQLLKAGKVVSFGKTKRTFHLQNSISTAIAMYHPVWRCSNDLKDFMNKKTASCHLHRTNQFEDKKQ